MLGIFLISVRQLIFAKLVIISLNDGTLGTMRGGIDGAENFRKLPDLGRPPASRHQGGTLGKVARPRGGNPVP